MEHFTSKGVFQLFKYAVNCVPDMFRYKIKVFQKCTKSVLQRIFVKSRLRNTFEHRLGAYMRTVWGHVLTHLRNRRFLWFNDGGLTTENLMKTIVDFKTITAREKLTF